MSTPATRGAEREIAHALARELERASQLLNELASDLGSHPDTLRRHMASLQSIDLVTQVQLAIAAFLRAEGTFEQRLAGVPLERVADRLRAIEPGRAA